jgi:hypothetical protein
MAGVAVVAEAQRTVLTSIGENTFRWRSVERDEFCQQFGARSYLAEAGVHGCRGTRSVILVGAPSHGRLRDGEQDESLGERLLGDIYDVLLTTSF